MGFFSDFVSNTTGSASAAVSNTMSSVQNTATHPIDTFINSPVVNNPLANPGATLFAGATGVSPAKQYAIGAAGGAAVVAGGAVAGAGWTLPGAMGPLTALTGKIPKAPAQTLVPQQQQQPAAAVPVAPVVVGVAALAALLFLL